MRWIADDALFGPDSLGASVLTESVLLLGGPRALLMQLAHPAVAAGVADHSDFKADPFGRLVRTLDAMNSIAFGPPADARATLDRLDRVHRGIRGTLDDGTPFRGDDPELLFWVHATLMDTALEVERRYLGQLTPDTRAAFYAESKLLAQAFDIPEALIPADLDAFERYMAEQESGLGVSATARELSRSILNPPIPLVPSPFWEPVRLVTIDMLARPLREGYGLTWDRRRKRLLRASQSAIRLVLPRIPRLVRNLPTAARRTVARAS